MNKFNSYKININSSLINVIERLEEIDGMNKCLFVLNDRKSVVGTVTDGDLRRGFIKGFKLNDSLKKFINPDFWFISDVKSLIKINEAKSKRIRLLPLLDNEKKILKIFDLTKLNAVLPVDAVIMAGGKGQRLRPLTDNTPKPMLPLGNKPIIEHNIDRLIKYGVENIYISVNYLAEQIIEYFGDGSSKGINIQYIKENKPLGTAGSLSLINEFKNDKIILMNSDLFTDVDFSDLYSEAVTQKASIAVSSVPYTINVPFAIFKKKGRQVIGLDEKPQYNNYANAGIYLINKELIKKIPRDTFYDAPDLIIDTVKSGGKVIDCPITGYWIDIGRHEEYEKALEIIKHL